MKRVHLYSSLTVEILLVNSHRPIWRAHIPSIIYSVLVFPEVHMPIKALYMEMGRPISFYMLELGSGLKARNNFQRNTN